MRPAKPAKSRRPTLKDKKRAETRSKLIAAAKRLFSEYGYNDVSVTEIAQEAGVTHSMINVYFGGKPGLLFEIVKQNNAPQYRESIEVIRRDQPAMDRLSDMLLLWARYDAADPTLLGVMQSYSWIWPATTEAENAKDRDQFFKLIAALLREAQSAGDIAAHRNADVLARSIFAIYTWEMRAAVFDGASPEGCHERLMADVLALTS